MPGCQRNMSASAGAAYRNLAMGKYTSNPSLYLQLTPNDP
jgi:hypothetical protein